MPFQVGDLVRTAAVPMHGWVAMHEGPLSDAPTSECVVAWNLREVSIVLGTVVLPSSQDT